MPTETWRLGSWNGTEGYPHVIGFTESRLVAATTDESPQSIWLSQSDDLQNMRPDSWVDQASTVEDDDAISITLNSKRVDEILWLAEQRELIVGTSGAEWIIEPTTGSVLTPASIRAKTHSTVPAADIEPVQITETVLFLDNSAREVHGLSYAYETESYTTTGLTILADHILKSPGTRLAYQRRPYSALWVLREDGRLAVLSYNKQHEVLGWTQIILGGDFSTGDAVVEDVVRYSRRRGRDPNRKLRRA